MAENLVLMMRGFQLRTQLKGIHMMNGYHTVDFRISQFN